MATSEANSSNENGFFNRKTTSDFGKAVASLTVMLNLVLVLLSNFIENGISNKWMVAIILLLSCFYVFVFIKKAKEESTGQYAFASLVNVALLFTSLTGANKVLDNIKPAMKEEASANTQASVGSVLYNLVFPVQSVFSEKREALEILNAAESNLDIASNIIGEISTTNLQSMSLYTSAVDTVKSYINALEKKYDFVEDKYNNIVNVSKRIINTAKNNSAQPAAVDLDAGVMPAPMPKENMDALPEFNDSAPTDKALEVQPTPVAQADVSAQQQQIQQHLDEQKKALEKQREELKKMRAKWSE